MRIASHAIFKTKKIINHEKGIANQTNPCLHFRTSID